MREKWGPCQKRQVMPQNMDLYRWRKMNYTHPLGTFGALLMCTGVLPISFSFTSWLPLGVLLNLSKNTWFEMLSTSTKISGLHMICHMNIWNLLDFECHLYIQHNGSLLHKLSNCCSFSLECTAGTKASDDSWSRDAGGGARGGNLSQAKWRGTETSWFKYPFFMESIYPVKKTFAH